MRPEDALDAARRAVAAARAEGRYAGEEHALPAEPADRVSTERLLEWAVIEPDVELVRSTRAWGRPITAAKRGLVHVLRQYLGQLAAQQTRFNLHAAVRLAELEERLEALERREP